MKTIKLSKNDWVAIGKKTGWLEKEAKWNEEDVVNPSEKGKYKGKSLSDLRSMLSNVKEKQKNYKEKNDGEAKKEYTDKIRELNFAIRSKTGWGKVK